ncbi:hypothetical protein PVAG01_05901 [Phlyctema vagabunda]|uniref:Uncharacterized protein n=1 Tax=Phlyctema vagabunda TaxID=108571 RepID=A0ABR4PEQ1_9HELO
MFLGRMLTGRREEVADLPGSMIISHERGRLVDEITQSLGRLQESARNQFLKIHVGGYRWYHADSYSFPDPAAFQNSRGVPRIDRWEYSDLLALKEALKEELISVECKRKRRVDEVGSSTGSVEKEPQDRPSSTPRQHTPTSAHNADGATIARLLQERQVLQDQVSYANKEIQILRHSVMTIEAEREQAKFELIALQAKMPKDEPKSALLDYRKDPASTQDRYSETDVMYTKWKAGGAPESVFLNRILKSSIDLSVAARLFDNNNSSTGSSPALAPATGRIPLPSHPPSFAPVNHADSPKLAPIENRTVEFETGYTMDKSGIAKVMLAKRSDSDSEISAADVTFIMTCLQNTNGGSLYVNIPAVAQVLNYTNPKSVSNKLAFMRKRYHIPIITGTKVRGGQGGADGNEESLKSPVSGPSKPRSKPSGSSILTPFTPEHAPPAPPPHQGIIMQMPSPQPRDANTPDTNRTPPERPAFPAVNDIRYAHSAPPEIAPLLPPLMEMQRPAESSTARDIESLPKMESPALKRGFVPVNGDPAGNPPKRHHAEILNNHNP